MSNTPKGLKYSKEHEWIKVDGDIATIGITDFAQGELGELVYVEVETVGETIAKDEVFGTVEAVKTTSDLFMPVSGEVLEFNNALCDEGDDNPGLINTNPYDDGWVIKVKMSDPKELDDLMDAAGYTALIA